MRPKAICILGMHRSGTAAVTRAVNLLGAYLGEEADLMPPAPDNPGGFWERNDIHNLHDRILHQLGKTWDTILPLPEKWHLSREIKPFRDELVELVKKNFLNHRLWAWKDPRTSILMPLWEEVLSELGIDLLCAIVIRNPLDVAKSLKKRNGFPYDKSFGIWFNYNIAAFLATSYIPRTFISYDRLLDDWELELRRCAAGSGIAWPEDESRLRKKMNAFIRPDMRHSASGMEELKGSDAPRPVIKLVELLNETLDTSVAPDASLARRVNRLSEEFRSYAHFVEHDMAELWMRGQKLVERDLKLAETERAIDSLKETVSREDAKIRELTCSISEKAQLIEELNEGLRSKDVRISELEGLARDREAALNNKIAETERAVDFLKETISREDSKIEELNEGLRQKDACISELEGLARDREAALNNIYNSHGWKVLLAYYKLRGWLLPENTRRRLFVKTIFNAVINPKGFFKNLNKTNLRRFIYYFKTADPMVLEEKVTRKIAEVSESDALPDGKLELDKDITVEKLESMVFPYYTRPLVSIIIPIWNKWEYTHHCLLSLLENTDGVSYEVIIINNASTDETSQMLGKIENIKLIRNETNLGFVKACNQGAWAARGDYVLFLNNDTRVTKGWLKAMVDIAGNGDRVGAVGAKLVYQDGRLQEAGGIVWNDGANLAWNYGRYDDPRRWEYNYVKEVDYCSGACLLVKRDLFESVGLFDEEFRPAYCEDTDLAFRIRESGYKVMYQPKAEVIHFEGTTAGTDTRKGVKGFQVVNQKKFYKKWEFVLESNNFKNVEDVFLARDRSQRKKVMLFVDHYVPTPDKDAGSFITYEYLKIFLDMGFKIIFWPDNLYKMEPYTEELQQMGIEVVYGPQNFKKYIKRYGKYVDVAYLARPNIAINYIEHIKRYSNAKILYCPHDLHFLREQRRALIDNKAKQCVKEVDGWKAKEFYLMCKSDVTLLFSEVEKEIIRKENPEIATAILSWVQPINGLKKVFKEKKDLVFIGGFAHMPNEDAVEWFVEEIFPLIKNKIHGIRFIVIGSHPTKRVSAMDSKDVLVKGFVKDVGAHFQDSRVFVAPLRYGAGFKGKIVHAMSYGLPVVTTSTGAEGMGLKDGENVLIADNAEDFADKVVALYDDQSAWDNLSVCKRK
jgi:GT2 family glycosyltransferase